ncbi:MBL fold metallo-hydrolase [Larkinella punicea]|uniref:MBL fold metallo-hydrolase n=1 Tax=Larkinella punicea TaxID=2315727 RepID=A0A368JTP3_9BACT|nr:MBL fold metallo-hydrolase [Larkinella punicea]RCR70822.1 MBL fold metallo-hydrolase [Larkinella punicea]
MERQTLENLTTREERSPYDVAEDVRGIKNGFVNVYFIGESQPGGKWVLIDTGTPSGADLILKKAREWFGDENPPQAIVLTHGHFDHAGSLEALLKVWGTVPVYAHPLEMPFLQGKSHYPPPDPSVGGGAMAYLSWMFPTAPYHFGDRIQPVPADGLIPELPDWKVIHTPGHSPGHISLFRESDRSLVAGDAFTNTDQNSAFAVMTQKEELHGPPAYFTIDWEAAKRSIQELAALNPTSAGTGHGKAIQGIQLPQLLEDLILHFENREVPKNGRYTKQPVHSNAEGIVDMPAPISYHVTRILSIGVIVGTVMLLLGSKRKR